MKHKHIFILLSGIILCILLYRNSLGSYFFQDDWFSLKIAEARNIEEFLRFFIPRTDVIYYRPLGMQVPFYILKNIFGIESFPFRLLNIITHIINTYLVYYLVKLLTKKSNSAVLTGFLYSTSAVFYIPFFWSATYAFMLGPTFFFLSFIFFLRALNSKSYKIILFSILFFIVGLFTCEMITILPILIVLYLILIGKFKERIISTVPHFLFLGLFFFSRFIFFKPPTTGAYKIGLDLSLLNNIKGYFLWSLNWPEEMKAQFISFFKVNPVFITGFSFYFYIFIFTFLINILLFILIPILFICIKRNKFPLDFIILGSGWFIIGLLPVLFFSQHSFSYYLSIPLVGLLLLFVTLFFSFTEIIDTKFKYFSNIMIFIVSVNWLACTYFTLDFNSKVHWAPKRAKISRDLIVESRRSMINNEIFIPDSSENKLSLNNQDAINVVYGESIKTIYTYGK
jgi:hypothetical protein